MHGHGHAMSLMDAVSERWERLRVWPTHHGAAAAADHRIQSALLLPQSLLQIVSSRLFGGQQRLVVRAHALHTPLGRLGGEGGGGGLAGQRVARRAAHARLAAMRVSHGDRRTGGNWSRLCRHPRRTLVARRGSMDGA